MCYVNFTQQNAKNAVNILLDPNTMAEITQTDTKFL